MSFHTGVTETILFEFWKTTDVGSLLGSIVLVFFLGVAYEGLKYAREFIQVSLQALSNENRRWTESSRCDVTAKPS
jgi:hypothetical protein